MAENFIDEQHNITEKSKIKKFYESNKILIFSSILILIILFGFSFVYLEKKIKKEFYYLKIIYRLNFTCLKVIRMKH